MELKKVENNKFYTWKNPKTGKSETVKGERINAYKINYPKAELIISEIKEKEQEVKQVKSTKSKSKES